MVFSQRNCLLLNEQFSKENSLVTLSFEDYSKSRKMFADKIKELRAKKGMRLAQSFRIIGQILPLLIRTSMFTLAFAMAKLSIAKRTILGLANLLLMLKMAVDAIFFFFVSN